MGDERKRLRVLKAEKEAAERAQKEKEKWLNMTYEEFEELRWKENRANEEKERAEERKLLGLKEEEEKARTVEHEVMATLTKGSPETCLYRTFDNRQGNKDLLRFQGAEMEVARKHLQRDTSNLSVIELRKRVHSRGIELPADIEEGSAAEKQQLLELLFDGGPLRENVLAAVKHNGWALRWATESQRTDREVVLEAVRTAGSVLELVAEPLRDDKDIVLTAVRQDGRALEFASAQLRRNEEIVEAAVRQCSHALKFAADELRSKPRFWITLEALAAGRLL